MSTPRCPTSWQDESYVEAEYVEEDGPDLTHPVPTTGPLAAAVAAVARMRGEAR